MLVNVLYNLKHNIVVIEIIKQNIHNLTLPISILLVTSLLVQLYYILLINTRALKKRTSQIIDIKNTEPLSVIICAKNEEENLKQNLPLILNQQYPDFEVIVVNDGSTDDSANLLAEFKQNYSNFNYTTIDENEDFYHGKKLALTVGIKAAGNDIIILTDADCFPKSNKWILNIAGRFRNSKNLILGYGGYEIKKGFLNKLIQFDTLTIAMQYLSLAVLGFPYMGVGRNIAYRKSLFIKNKGFASHAYVLSGDDDLFVNEVSTKENTDIIIDKNSQTLSKPKETFLEWLNQKQRHLSTGKFYKTRDKIILSVENMSRLIFYLCIILLFILKSFSYYIIGIYLIRLISQLTVQKLFMKKFEMKKILIFSPIFDMLIPIFNLYLLFTSYLTQRNIKWK